MVGKTEAEVAALTENLYGNYQRLAAQPSTTAAPPSYAPAPAPMTGAPDPSLAYSNPAAYQQQLTAYMQSQFRQEMSAFAAPFAANQADTARALSRAEYADVWRRWEPEIEMELSSIAPQQRNKQMYDTAARIVRGNHAEELAQERAEKLMAQVGGSGTERGVNVGNVPAAPIDKLDELYDTDHPYFRFAREQGVTKSMIREHCAKVHVSVDDYVANATLGNVIVSKNGYERRSS